MGDAVKPALHGRDHLPGGTDPIPGLNDNAPWARRILTSNEDIASGTNDELIIWDADDINDPDYFTATSTTVLTVDVDGLYEISGELMWDSSKIEGSVVTLNANTTPGFFWNKGFYDEQNAGHTIEHSQAFSFQRRLEAGTGLRLYVVHFAGVTRTIQGSAGGNDSYMEVRYLGSYTGTAPGD